MRARLAPIRRPRYNPPVANHQRKLDDLLYDAINDGNWKRARKLARTGAGVNKVSDDWTPLSWAVVHKKWKICEVLLEQGADPNLGGQAQSGALTFACGRDPESVKVAKLLIQHGLPPNQLLHAACKSGTVGTVRGLLNRGADPNLLDEQGEVPLRDARSPAIIRELFRHGADPLAYNSDKSHPLHYNAVRGRARNLRALLAGGVPANLPEIGDGYALYHAIDLRRNNCVKVLLEAGADPNLVSATRSQTPLMVACWLGLVPIVTLLLKHGADPHGARRHALVGLKREPEREVRYREILALLPPESPTSPE